MFRITKASFVGMATMVAIMGTVSSFVPASRIASRSYEQLDNGLYEMDHILGRTGVIFDESCTFGRCVALASSTASTTDKGTARNSSDRNRNNNNNNRRRNNNNNNNSNNNASNSNNYYKRGPGGGGAGGGMPALKLENPMKVVHIVKTPPPQQERDERDDNNRGGGRGGGGGQDRRQGGGDRRQGGGNGGQGGGGRGRGPVASVGTDTSSSPGTRPKGKTGVSSGGEDYGDYSSEAEDGPSGDDSPPSRDGGGGRKRLKQGRKSGREDRDNRDDGGRNNRKTSLRVGGGRSGRAATLTSRRGSLKKRDRTAEREAREEAAIERRTVSLPEGPITVSELAELIDEKPVGIIKFLMTDLGVMASMTQSLDPATCVAVCEGFGRIVGGANYDDDEDEELDEGSALAMGFVVDEDDEEDLEPRSPVVTIMGHVDHGKTSLLDAIRNTRVTKGEAGGITQHIAAYRVDHQGNPITFIDTPGHAAFTDMRERGANITDIVILVVAADDGVKQQTADSIACARQAGVPLVVAINKCDLETADPTRVKSELTSYDILTEELGGDVLCSEISAKDGTGLDDLLDKIMLQAEVEDLKANPNRKAEAFVVEALVEKGLGTVATSLVKKGTLRIGDIFVAGETYGRVRTLISTNDGKTRLKEVGPGVPVRIVGFEGVPSAGDSLVVVDDEQTARMLAENRQRLARERSSASYQDSLMESVAMTFGSNKERREMCVVVKADVMGSAEALTRSLRELKRENDEAIVTVKVLVSGAGDVSKSDIAIAAVTPGTTVLAFNVAASYEAMESARSQDIPIEYYNIVYDAIESVESRMQEVLSPTPDGEYTGSAVVQEVFNIGGLGNIAGSRCQDGVLRKGGNVRVMRGDKILCESKIKSLRNFKAEADSIEAGNECGIGLIDFENYEPGDVIECYIE